MCVFSRGSKWSFSLKCSFGMFVSSPGGVKTCNTSNYCSHTCLNIAAYLKGCCFSFSLHAPKRGCSWTSSAPDSQRRRFHVQGKEPTCMSGRALPGYWCRLPISLCSPIQVCCIYAASEFSEGFFKGQPRAQRRQRRYRQWPLGGVGVKSNAPFYAAY